LVNCTSRSEILAGMLLLFTSRYFVNSAVQKLTTMFSTTNRHPNQ